MPIKFVKEARLSFIAYKKYRRNTLTTSKPFKKLTKYICRTGGRNNTGAITVRHIGGGSKKLYRMVSFRRKFFDICGTVKTVEIDPNRNAFISLISYPDDKFEYILHPSDLKVGDRVVASFNCIQPRPGNCTILKNISRGSYVHNVELYRGRGGKVARSAGNYAEVVDHVNDYTLLKLSSSFVIKVKSDCMATFGRVSNYLAQSVQFYKAGQNRNLGVRPTTRGVAMNPVDHPHGGGEGKTGTKRHPVSYTGKLTKGKKTGRLRRNFVVSRKDRRNK